MNDKLTEMILPIYLYHLLELVMDRRIGKGITLLGHIDATSQVEEAVYVGFFSISRLVNRQMFTPENQEL